MHNKMPGQKVRFAPRNKPILLSMLDMSDSRISTSAFCLGIEAVHPQHASLRARGHRAEAVSKTDAYLKLYPDSPGAKKLLREDAQK